MRYKGLAGIVVLLVIVGIILTGCGKKNQEDQETVAEAPMTVSATQVIKGTIQEITDLTGTVTARQTVAVVSKAMGRVSAVDMQVGQRVNKGDTLLRLDAEELTLQLQQAEAGLAGQQAQLASLKRGVAEEDLLLLKASYDNAQLGYNRIKSLFEAGATTQQQLEEVQLRLLEAQTRYQKAVKGATAEELAAMEAAVAASQASVELMRTQLNNTVIKAPISGVIAASNAQLGELVTQGAMVATIVNIDTVEVEVNVSERIINQIKPGDKVQVTIGAVSSEALTGEILTVSPAANPQTRQFGVKISLDNREGLLRPGMFAQIHLVTNQAADAIKIPKEAVVAADGNRYVFVVNGDRAEKKSVQLGLENHQLIQITSGLNYEDQVVIKGQHRLEDGQLVLVENGGGI